MTSTVEATWAQPREVTDLDMAFGVNALSLMPPLDEIPEEFQHWRGAPGSWIEFQADWFYSGLPSDTTFHPREGVDPKLALRHLKVIQGSWEPQHEHKQAAVAFLASLWFERAESAHKTYGGAA